MTFVVTESCIKCKYTECVGVCSTDAFSEGPNFLAIEPDDCIDDLPKLVAKFSVLEDQVKKVVTNAGALTEKVKANPSLLLRRPEKKESNDAGWK